MDAVSKSAFVQNRHKLLPSYFQEQNQLFVEDIYADDAHPTQYLRGFRLVCVDGTTFTLPNTDALAAVYGRQHNQHRQNKDSGYVKARVSVAYDPLNGYLLDGQLAPFSQGEPTLAMQHLNQCSAANDLWVYDRGYNSFSLLYAHLEQQTHCLIRLRSNYGSKVKSFIASGKQQAIVQLKPSHNTVFAAKPYQRSSKITVRLLRIETQTEPVFLMTTLLDKQYDESFFSLVYAQRWGVETRYDVLKNVLEAECFSGQSQQVIEQDFYICLLLLNLENLLKEGVQQKLDKRYRHRKHRYKVNTRLAVGRLKDHFLELMCVYDTRMLLQKLERELMKYAEPERSGRSYARNTEKWRRRLKPKFIRNRKPVL